MLCWPRRIDEGFTLAEDWDTQSLIRCSGAFRSDFRTCRRRTSGAKKAGTFAFAWVAGLRWMLWSFNSVASIELIAGSPVLQRFHDSTNRRCPQSCPQAAPAALPLLAPERVIYGAPEASKVSKAYLVARYSPTTPTSVLWVARTVSISSRSLQLKQPHQCARLSGFMPSNARVKPRRSRPP
jgi:hypothetical protein